MVRSVSSCSAVACSRPGRNPGEQDGGDDPAPFDVAEPADRRAGRNRTTSLDDRTRAGDGSGASTPLPDILDRGR